MFSSGKCMASIKKREKICIYGKKAVPLQAETCKGTSIVRSIMRVSARIMRV